MVYGKDIGMMVSVIMVTYGHEKYISDAINGVFIQKTDFPVELIIANDCSPDNTDEVVKLLLRRAPPNITVRYTKHHTNKGANANFSWAALQATGKYIALCEGDDYWTDPLKLQKQVDFLEKNDDVVACGTFVSILRGNILEKQEPPATKGVYNVYDVISANRLPTLTLMFRANELHDVTAVRDDTSLLLNLSKNGGKLGKLPFVSAVYRYHGKGANSGKSFYENTKHQFQVKHEFALKFGDGKFNKLLKKHYLTFIVLELKNLIKLRFTEFSIKVIFLSIYFGLLKKL